MAWSCSGRTNAELVDNLAAAGYAAAGRVVEVMKAVDRAWFAPTSPYEDRPVPLGHNATISAPHMHAHALSALDAHLKPGMRALDVGSGSGYVTACMAALVGPSGLVVGVEHVAPLVRDSERAVERARRTLPGRLAPTVLVAGDGRQGSLEHAPFDCIHVGAAAPGRPDALLAQLKPGGVLYTPEVTRKGLLGEEDQVIVLYTKRADGTLQRAELLPVRYVPLTDLAEQLRPW